MYSCHLFLISLASVRSLQFLSFIEPIFAWHVPLVSLIFLKTSLVFPILLFSYISLHWSLREAFLSLLAILGNSAFRWVYLSFYPFLFASIFLKLFVRPPQTVIVLLVISHASKCSKFSKPCFNSMWTMKFQMFMLHLEKAEELQIKMQTSIVSWKKAREFQKTIYFCFWLCQSLWLCGSQ